jgi:hypothetical protein
MAFARRRTAAPPHPGGRSSCLPSHQGVNVGSFVRVGLLRVAAALVVLGLVPTTARA